MGVPQLQAGPMQGILRELLDGLLQATSGQQLSRAYLYGALLYYLQLTSEQTADQFTGNHCVPIIVTIFVKTGIVHTSDFVYLGTHKIHWEMYITLKFARVIKEY